MRVLCRCSFVSCEYLSYLVATVGYISVDPGSVPEGLNPILRSPSLLAPDNSLEQHSRIAIAPLTVSIDAWDGGFCCLHPTEAPKIEGNGLTFGGA